MDRTEFWGLYGRLVTAGHTAQADTLGKAWNDAALLVGKEWVADIDPTPWEELLDEKSSGEGP